ncbi:MULTISPECIES: hypothetical protein [unclassified Coleofasciculus]|uniref:hypothetical protein n=1 Tax=unclassified Coleofasciculus TaxID=2692782 RepID=UPI00187FB7AE|nr:MULTISPECIES: hypothetical protein [unclassified Coleofasciculus]MBE9129618.1 hypothetical protein [Coleofasciculus sp. LEGE 07081]MBE9152152.1 hypothetical protein [Coleofasciculus sp. LEGE 07092]
MGIRQRIQKKKEDDFIPVPSQLQTRPFGNGIQARQKGLPVTNPLQMRPFGSRHNLSSLHPETTDIQTQLKRAEQFGYNAANIPVLAPEKEDSSQNQIATHNHPGGAPPNQGNILSAIEKGIKEVRAVGIYGTFALRRTAEAWQISNEKVTSAFAKGIEKWSQECPPELANHHLPNKGIPQTGATFKEDLFMANYFACKILAKQSNGAVIYEHPNEKELIEKRSKLYRDRTILPIHRQLTASSNQADPGSSGSITPLKQVSDRKSLE